MNRAKLPDKNGKYLTRGFYTTGNVTIYVYPYDGKWRFKHMNGQSHAVEGREQSKHFYRLANPEQHLEGLVQEARFIHERVGKNGTRALASDLGPYANHFLRKI